VPALVFAALLAGLVCFVTFVAKGGLSLESMTTAEIVLTLLAAALTAAAITLAAGSTRSYGMWCVGLLLAFAALTALSVVWSVAPAASWLDAGRMFAYAAVFGAAVALVRVAPERWPAVLGGVTLAAVVVCAYALATKVFPSLAPSSTYARLQEPFGYWNAIGLLAAIGALGSMWLGARRSGHALVSALAYPAMGVLLVTLALAYSRGALAALAVGVALWLCIVPLRLRGATVLIVGGVAAAGVAAYAFTTHALDSENVALALRTSAGHRLGALLVAMVALLTLAGLAIGFATSRSAPSPRTRRRGGMILLGLLVAAIVAFGGALAHSHRGFTGSISHAVDALTNPNAKTPPNTPGRLTAVASVRARYWKEALEVFRAHPVLGAGAMGYQTARLRYRTAPLVVAHAHGFVVQTLADLGIVGLGLALALLACWLAAAGRATHPFNRRWTPWSAWRELRSGDGAGPRWRALAGAERHYSAERVGLLSMLCIVVCFGVHSLVDWTWYVPGVACVALICAGWLAGRGPLQANPAEAGLPAGAAAPAAPAAAGGEPPSERARPRSLREIGHTRLVVAAAVLAAALLAAWAQWQPQRAETARQHALEALASDPRAALASAKLAVSRNPVSPLALTTLAEVQQAAGEPAQALATLQRAVREQPSNPQTWLALGRYELAHDPPAALAPMQAAVYLDPESIAPELLSAERRDPEAIEIYNEYVRALRASAAARTAAAAAAAAALHRHAHAHGRVRR
jgi:hypothetical protein